MDNSASRCVQKKSHRTALRSPRPGGASVFEPALSETPSKLQRSSKSQAPNPKKQMPGQTAHRSVLSLGLGASLELGVWNWSFLPGLSASQKLRCARGWEF